MTILDGCISFEQFSFCMTFALFSVFLSIYNSTMVIKQIQLINYVGNWEGSKIGQICRRIVYTKSLPTWPGGGGCKKSGKNAEVVYGWSLCNLSN